MRDEDHDEKGVYGALFVAAGFAVIVFAGVVLFSPERTASRAPTPVPLTAEVESLGAVGASPEPAAAGDAGGMSRESAAESTNRNERAKGMFKWDR